jgi:3-dehydrosphinganine reductase
MFKGKTIIITGGSSGLGAALALRLAERGAILALVARNQEKLRSVQDKIRLSGYPDVKVEIFSSDVRDAESVEQTVRAISEKLGKPDILINSAGILKENYFELLPVQTFQEIMDINFFGILLWIKAVLPFFKQKGEGRIVNICSMGGLIGTFGYSAYCSSKHAITGLTSSLRVELKPQNIKCHLVCPSEFESPMVDELNTYRTAENRKMVQTIPVMGIQKVGDSIIRGIEKDQYLIVPGTITRFFERLNRYFPSLTRRTSDWIIRRCYQGPDV